MKPTSNVEGSRTDEEGAFARPSVFRDPVDAVKRGRAGWEWAEVVLAPPGSTKKLHIGVMKEPIRFDTHNGSKIRACVSAFELQEIAQHIGAVFHTRLTVNAKAKAANTIIQPISVVGNKRAEDVSDREISCAFDNSIHRLKDTLGRNELGIVSTFGPTWITHHWYQDMINGEVEAELHGQNTALLYGGHCASGRELDEDENRIMRDVIHPTSEYSFSKMDKLPGVFADLVRDRATLVHADGSEEAVWLSDVYQDEDLAPLVSGRECVPPHPFIST